MGEELRSTNNLSKGYDYGSVTELEDLEKIFDGYVNEYRKSIDENSRVLESHIYDLQGDIKENCLIPLCAARNNSIKARINRFSVLLKSLEKNRQIPEQLEQEFWQNIANILLLESSGILKKANDEIDYLYAISLENKTPPERISSYLSESNEKSKFDIYEVASVGTIDVSTPAFLSGNELSSNDQQIQSQELFHDQALGIQQDVLEEIIRLEEEAEAEAQRIADEASSISEAEAEAEAEAAAAAEEAIQNDEDDPSDDGGTSPPPSSNPVIWTGFFSAAGDARAGGTTPTGASDAVTTDQYETASDVGGSIPGNLFALADSSVTSSTVGRFTYTVWGEWSSSGNEFTGQGWDALHGHVVFGFPTPDADMPSTGSAAYSGGLRGDFFDGSGSTEILEVNAISGNATIVADFGSSEEKWTPKIGQSDKCIFW